MRDYNHIENLLKRYYNAQTSEQEEQEWIDTILKLIAEIEGKLDQLKRQLWRKKHYGN